MNSYQDFSAGSQYTFDMANGREGNSFGDMQPRWLHLDNQPLQMHGYEQSSAGDNDGYSSYWPSVDITIQPYAHSHHLSVSSFSSATPSFRSSRNSGFSETSLRDSVASSASGWSRASNGFPDQHVLQTKQLLSRRSLSQSSNMSSPAEEPSSVPAKRRAAKKPAAQERDYFKTCVSANKQPRTCSKEHRYFCTSCKKPFVEKADWKRHEETYQERPEMFQCDLCPAIYFLEKDFTGHHVQSHRCAPCSGSTKWNRKSHVLSAKRSRMTRTGWGCGFCCHFSSDWTERCNHLAHHMEKQGLTASHWIHSNVIQSLLQRPQIYYEWRRVVQGMQLHTVLCLWSQHSTGRVEGYPESNPVAQLQDYLEYFTPDQDAAALAQLAYRKMIRHSAPSAEPPPVPLKDRRAKALQDCTKHTELWSQFMDSVLEDEVLPRGVCHTEDWYAA
ncbi:hypothetical protein ACJQWK_03828 [Exserohilum turcicum]|uniref:C2H2-type domain-containing protein n=1 Tax=Exserohilum turcicum (strain 28A) TaxID=671987 RepID=R0J6F9_EXST2|nr:uncharacterized protein SETTUDRAFT_162708 [Exserohilum turcica Et28A]EOA92281.1 hypothetical protein SETTUDRAFT_162708 [Exserohilum turcica Et28A]